MPHNSETLSKPVGFEVLGEADLKKMEMFSGKPADKLTISDMYNLLNNYNFRDTIAASLGREKPIITALVTRTNLLLEGAQFAGSTMQGLDPDDVRQQLKNIADAYKEERPPPEDDFIPF